MKNKRLLAILAMSMTLSVVMTACGFGGDKPEEQVVAAEVTPTPAPTETPAPTPTIAPDAQSTTYTSADKAVSIELPDATWARKADEPGMLSFESPKQGKMLILHGQGEDDMSSAVIPSTQDMAVSLEKASDLAEGTDFEIQDYKAEDVSGIGVYSYTVKYLDTEKSGGFAYIVNKVFANDSEFYSIAASVTPDDADALSNMQKSVGSFTILGDSTLKPAAAGSSAKGKTEGTAEETTTPAAEGNFSEEAMSDTEQTRTIYRNEDGAPLVITPDGNGNWVDTEGNTYNFTNDTDVYNQDGVDYYYHGEAADVYYMPAGGGEDTEESSEE